MLLGGGGNCQGCGCKSCQDCTRTCTDPHTGDAFEVVYSYKFEGAEAGNTSDGYLTAVGDADSSDPYDGMDGSSPWQQQITGSFSLNNTQTRYPCWVRVSFWRSNFVLGAATVPPPSDALTVNEVKITNNAGSVGSVMLHEFGTILAPGESYTYTSIIPVVSGSGDQSGNDPRFNQGSIAFRQACANESVTVDVSATIKWTTQKRQHILYGIVRECYETGSPCASFCGGTASPSVMYLTISNLEVTGKDPLANQYPSSAFINEQSQFFNDTFVLDRVPNVCGWFRWSGQAGECSAFSESAYAEASETGVRFGMIFGLGNTCRYSMTFSDDIPAIDQEPLCDPFSYSGTGTTIFTYMAGDGPEQDFYGSFDWTLES